MYTVASYTATDFAARAAFLAKPLEDVPYDPSLFGHYLITRVAATLVLANVTIAVGRR
jgi:hypothetical protein